MTDRKRGLEAPAPLPRQCPIHWFPDRGVLHTHLFVSVLEATRFRLILRGQPTSICLRRILPRPALGGASNSQLPKLLSMAHKEVRIFSIDATYGLTSQCLISLTETSARWWIHLIYELLPGADYHTFSFHLSCPPSSVLYPEFQAQKWI